ncbi:MAG: hypothetical protein AB7I27_19725 [Bacteriovoracaceae bacterium]
MNSNISTNKTTKELKEQILSDIQKIKDDFNEIRERLTPGQLIDDALYYRKGSASPASTFDYMKTNPVGTSFLTIGTLLLMEDENHQSYENITKSKVNQARGRMSGVVSQTKDKVAQFRSRFVRGESDLTESEGTLEERANIVKSNIKERTHQFYEASKNLDPLTYLVLGMGLGTITGASLPISEREEKFVESLMQENLGSFAEELEGALNQSVNILKNEFIGSMTQINFDLF